MNKKISCGYFVAMRFRAICSAGHCPSRRLPRCSARAFKDGAEAGGTEIAPTVALSVAVAAVAARTGRVAFLPCVPITLKCLKRKEPDFEPRTLGEHLKRCPPPAPAQTEGGGAPPRSDPPGRSSTGKRAVPTLQSKRCRHS